MIDPRLTRGFLNNNPGNIDRGTPWNGEVRDVSKCTNDIQRKELTQGRFCVFVDAEHGIRAMALNLRAYRDHLSCKTIRDYINRWAPPNENNTAAYIATVAHTCGVGPDDPVDIERPVIMHALIDAIIRVECAGMPYQGNEVDAGIALAGIASIAAAPAPDPAIVQAPSKTVVVGTIATAGATANAADQISKTVDAVNGAAAAATSVTDLMLKLTPAVLSVLVVAAIGFVVWRYVIKRNRGEIVST